MAQYKDSDEIVNSVKRRFNIPDHQSTFQASDILAIANDEMAVNMVPSITRLDEDFFLYEQTTTLVASQNAYTIPYRAIGNSLKDMFFKDTNNNVYEMTRINKSEKPAYQGFGMPDTSYVYYIENNKVVMVPDVGGSPTGSLVFSYYLRPSDLVDTDRIGVISAIDTDTGVVTLSSVPDHFTTSLTYDLYIVRSPHRPIAIDLTATDVDSTASTITFTASDLPDDLQVGDHVAQATECSIPQIPSDFHTYLVNYTIEVIAEAQGDDEGLKNSKVRNAQGEVKLGTLVDNRVDDDPIKLVNRDGLIRKGLVGRSFRRKG